MAAAGQLQQGRKELDLSARCLQPSQLRPWRRQGAEPVHQQPDLNARARLRGQCIHECLSDLVIRHDIEQRVDAVICPRNEAHEPAIGSTWRRQKVETVSVSCWRATETLQQDVVVLRSCGPCGRCRRREGNRPRCLAALAESEPQEEWYRNIGQQDNGQKPRRRGLRCATLLNKGHHANQNDKCYKDNEEMRRNPDFQFPQFLFFLSFLVAL